jgi:hypothetical protein
MFFLHILEIQKKEKKSNSSNSDGIFAKDGHKLLL